MTLGVTKCSQAYLSTMLTLYKYQHSFKLIKPPGTQLPYYTHELLVKNGLHDDGFCKMIYQTTQEY